MQMRKHARRLMKLVVAAFVIIALTAASLLGAAQTRWARGFVSQRISARLSSSETGVRVTVGPFDALSPWRIRAPYVKVEDARGVCAVVEDFYAECDPFSLLRGKIHVTSAEASSISFRRFPENAQSRSPKGSGAVKTFGALARFKVDDLRVSKVVIEDERAPVNTEFAVEASFGRADATGEIHSVLRVRPLSGPATFAKFDVDFNPDLSQLSAKGEYNEEPGGPIARLLKFPDGEPITLLFSGEGSPVNWRGSVDARFGSMGGGEATLRGAFGERIEISAEGAGAAPIQILPGPAQEWLDSELRFYATLSVDPSGCVDVRELAVESEKFSARVNGSFDIKSGAMDASYSASAFDTAALEKVIPIRFEAPVDLSGIVSGSWRQPSVSMTASVSGPEFVGVKASKAKVNVEVEPLAPLFSAFSGARFKASGTLDKLSFERAGFFPARDWSWSCDAELGSDGVARVKDASACVGDAVFRAEGEARPFEGTGKLSYDFEAANVAEFLGDKAKVGGKISAKGAAEFSAPEGVVSASFSGEANNVTGLPLLLDEAVKGEASFSGAISFDAARNEARLEEFKAKTANASVEGGGKFEIADKQLDVSCAAQIPKTKFLSSVLKRDVDGDAKIIVEARGEWPELSVKLEAETKDVRLEAFRADSLKLVANAEGVPSKIKGRFEGYVGKRGRDGKVRADFAVKDESLSFEDIRTETPDGKISGDLAVSVETGLCKGALKGSLSDLSWLGQLLGRDMVGRADAKLKFEAVKEAQNISVDASVSAVRFESLKLENGTIVASLKNVLKAPYGTARLELTQGALGRLSMRKASMELDGDPRQGTLSLNFDGEYGAPVNFALQGKLARSDKDVTVRVTKFQGQGGGIAAKLAQGFDVDLNGGIISAGKARFALEPSGDVTLLGARMDADSVHVEAALSGASLDKVSFGGRPIVSGVASGSLTIDGDPARPHGAAELRVKDAKPLSTSLGHVSATSATLKATLDDGVLRLALSEEGGLLGTPLKGALDAPVRFSVFPFACGIQGDAPLRGSFETHVDLARLGDLLLLDDQRLEGAADLSLEIGGTPNRPEVAGNGTVHDGYYEHFVTGTIVKDIQATLSGDGSKIRISNARGTDGAGGRIEANGTIEMSLAKTFPLDIGVVVKQSKVVRRDDVTAILDADLHLSGTLPSPKISGKARGNSVEINLRERTAQPIVALEVVDKKGTNAVKTDQDDKPKIKRGNLRSRCALDIDLELPGKTIVRDVTLDSEWKGTFHIAGNALEPAISGNATVVRGRINLLGKRFELTKGEVHFPGTWPLAPTVEIESETELKDMTGYLKISGPTSSPTVNVESDPSAPRDEILARMLFNRDLARISPIEALQLAEAADVMAGGRGLFQFTERARKILRVDSIDVTQDNNGSLKDSSVRVGKYLRNGVYVQFEQGLNAESSKVQTEVNITPNLSVESTVDKNAKTGIGLKWKKDY